MPEQNLSAIVHKTPVTGLTDTAAPIDLARLRSYRLGRSRPASPRFKKPRAGNATRRLNGFALLSPARLRNEEGELQ